MYNKILIIVLSFIIILFCTLKTIGDVYYSFAVSGLVILTIILLLLFKINIKLKVALITCLLILYRNNLYLTIRFFSILIKEGYINKVQNRLNNDKFRDIVYNMFSTCVNLKLDFSRLPSKPSIIVCNYCWDRLENITCILIPKDIVILMRDTLIKISKLDKLIKWAIYTKEKGSYEDTKRDILEHTKEGRFIFSYISKHPKLGVTHIQGVRSGMFNLAKELNIPITLMVIDYIDTDSFGRIRNQNFNILVGDTFKVDNVNESVYRAKKFFKTNLIKFQKDKYKGII